MTNGPVHAASLLDDQARPRLALGARLHADASTGRLVLLFPEGMLQLNSTGAAILELCDGRTSADLLASLATRFNVPADVLRADVTEYLRRLIQRGLVRLDTAAHPTLVGTSNVPQTTRPSL